MSPLNSLAPPAKINWFLAVRGRRPDGYHDIDSLIQCVSLHDSLTFEHSDTIDVISGADIPVEDNLVYKAARLIAERTGCKRGCRIRLDKRIPLAAGLGGGSSDAAHTLIGLNSLWELGLGAGELEHIGAEIGSDVPVFVRGGASVVSSRGEIVKPVDIAGGHVLLLLKPSVGVSAGWAYKNLKQIDPATFPSDDFIKALGIKDWTALRKLSRNDLEAPVFGSHPEIAALKESLYANGAVLSLMSGSGSTVFGVFESDAKAESAREEITRDKDLWSAITRTLSKP